MLENKRYWLAQRAMVNLRLHPASGQPDRDTFETVLEQQYATQSALASLGASAHTPPSETPYINTPFFPNSRPASIDKPVAIHVIGMPKTLKTTILETLIQVGSFTIGNKRILVSHNEETAGPIKRIRDRRGESKSDYTGYVLSQVLANIMEARMEQIFSQGTTQPRVVFINRGMIDMIPYNWANFLFGRLDIAGLAVSLGNIKSGMGSLEHYHNAVMLLLISSDESLKRNRESGDMEYGRAMNPKFLNTLYEQYLRFHYGMVKTQAILPILNQQVPYCCIDMSGESVSEPISRYLNFVAACLHYFFD